LPGVLQGADGQGADSFERARLNEGELRNLAVSGV
jgi:hypothetical protein